MEPIYIALIILAIIHVGIFIYIKWCNKTIQEKGLVPYGPLIMIKTQWGIKLIDRLGKYKRFWRACGLLSRAVVIILMVWIVAILVIDLLAIPSLIGNSGIGIEYALAIPGLNPMLPLVYGWIGLIIAMVIHELAHGMQTRANDMDVKSTGILWGVVPLGAFVEPNDEQVEKASRRAKLDLYSAGITTNFIAALVLFILIFSMMTTGVTSEYGSNPAVYGVTADSPGYESGIPATAIIIEVDGVPVNTLDDFYGCLSGYGSYDITYVYKNETATKSVVMGVFINSVVSDSPASSAKLEKGMFIESIYNDRIGKVTFATANDFSKVMKSTNPGEVVNLDYVDRDGTHRTLENITLGSNNGVGYLGISTSNSGFTFTTPDIVRDTGINPIYGCTDLKDCAIGVLSYMGNAFSGFSPVPESTHWWYHCEWMSDDAFCILMSVIFWTMWLNLVLGVTNAIPAVPFDGGFVFIFGVDYILDKMGVKGERKDRYVGTIGNITSYLMISILMLVMIVIIF